MFRKSSAKHHGMRRGFGRPPAVCLGLVVGLLISSAAQAGMFVSPIRINFEGRDRSATVTLLNQKQEEATYRIYWRELMMKPNGQYEEMPKGQPVAWSAAQFIRYSPRQVTLAGVKSQLIRLALRKPKDLPPGEYRSHLVFEEQPKPREPGQAGGEGMRLDIQVVMSFSIPVIVRHGEISTEVLVPEIKIVRGEEGWKVEALLESRGTKSPTGAVRLYWVGPDGGESKLSEMNNVNVLLPQTERFFELPFERPDTPGKLRFLYQEAEAVGRSARKRIFGQVFVDQFVE